MVEYEIVLSGNNVPNGFTASVEKSFRGVSSVRVRTAYEDEPSGVYFVEEDGARVRLPDEEAAKVVISSPMALELSHYLS